MAMEAYTYTSIFVLGLIFAFLDAFGIGANDVANSFATSVSSKSLTLRQAYVIAAICEFSGGIALGASVGDTIKNKIIDVSLFNSQPELLMLAFLCALVGSSTWILFATKMGWPVSTTHSIIGAVAGVGMAAFGVNTPDWGWKGIGSIVASWFISPVAAGIIAVIVFLFTKVFVLKADQPVKRGLAVIPIYIFFTFFVGSLFLILKSGQKVTLTAGNAGYVFGGSVGCGVFTALVSYVTLIPWLRRVVEKQENMRWFHAFAPYLVKEQSRNADFDAQLEKYMDHGARNFDEVSISGAEEGKADIIEQALPTTAGPGFKDILKQKFDVTKVQTKRIADIHNAAEKFDPKVEYLYSFVQVCTASFSSFAHGSNDLANAVGPLAAIYNIWVSGAVSASVPINKWNLAYGAFALVLGFLFFGHHIMVSLGNNLTFHSPSRGFSMEFGAALTVLTASYIGLPVSTTHCITGATAAVGIANGTGKAMNWRMLAWCLFSWMLTLPIAGLISGALYAFISTAPHF